MEKEEKVGVVEGHSAVDAGRRSAMRKIAVSVGVLATYSVLPESWTRPVIGQIVVPVHAATSGSSLHDPCSVDQRSGDQKSETVVIKVTGYVTPPVGDLPVMIVATATGGANQRVEGQTRTYPDGTFEAYLTVGGGPGITSIGVTTTVTGADGSANCSVNITTAASDTIISGNYSDFIPFSSTCEDYHATLCVSVSGNNFSFSLYDPDYPHPNTPISGSGQVGVPLTVVDHSKTVNITISNVTASSIDATVQRTQEGCTDTASVLLPLAACNPTGSPVG